jgi:hypothetical protein
MEELRSPLPQLPRDQDPRRTQSGGEQLVVDARNGPSVREVWPRLPFAREPRRRFWVVGCEDGAEAIRLCGRDAPSEFAGGYRWHRSEAAFASPNRILVTVHFEPTFGAEWTPPPDGTRSWLWSW